MRTPLAVIVALALGGDALAGPAPVPFKPGPADAFQIPYVSNLNVGDSVVNITNAGSLAGTHPAGNICVHVYAFDPSENMIACCSCTVTPNALVSLSARSDLIANTLTPAVPNSILVKLLATKGTPCNDPTAATLVPGMRAWGTTIHAAPTTPVTYAVTETEFTPAVLSATELTTLSGGCQFIQNEGGGYGICRSCRLGGQ